MLGRYSATARHAGRTKMPQPRWSRCMTLECSLTSMDGRRRAAATASRQVGHVELYLTAADEDAEDAEIAPNALAVLRDLCDLRGSIALSPFCWRQRGR